MADEMRIGDHNDTCSLALCGGDGRYECDCYAGRMRQRALDAEAELARMRPVVEAAIRWITNTRVDDYDVDMRSLEDAVGAYQQSPASERGEEEG